MSVHSVAHFIKDNYPQYYSLESYPADKTVTVGKVADEWGIFCNFAQTPLDVDGVTFKNVEQLFQMMKFTDVEPIRDLYSSNGMTIKMKAKKWETSHRRPDWGEMIVDALKFCLMLKYEQSAEFRETLAKSAGLFIVEDQTSRRKKTPDTWGVKLEGDCYKGPNLLGRLLMELRDTGTLEYHLPEDALAFLDIIKRF